MKTIATMADGRLHELIFRLSERRRRGDLATGELLGRLLDEADRRAAALDVDPEDGAAAPGALILARPRRRNARSADRARGAN